MDTTLTTRELLTRFETPILTIDSHTGGEPTRLIVDGLGPIPGATMADKRRYFMDHLDHVRLQLTREPRGHRGMFAALVTEPVSPGAAFGLIYMDPRRCPYLCGHATMGAVTTLIEAGTVPVDGPETTVVVDTPSGPMEAVASVRDGRVRSVAIEMVPSFVWGTGELLEVPGLGQLQVDTVCVGGFFVMVAADQIGLELDPANAPRLIDLGMRIIEEANRQLTVRHPTRPEVATVDVVEFHESSPDHSGRGKNAVVYGEAHLDRSPCGTGTTAKLTLLHRLGKVAVGQPYVNQGLFGTTFEGRVKRTASVGELAGVVVEVRGTAHITGIHQFLLDPADPFPRGFLA